MTAPSTTRVELFAHQMDSAFAGAHWHSVLRNLESCTRDDWDWIPPGGGRTIRDLVSHLGVCKVRWQDQLFGERKLDWEAAEAQAARHVTGAPEDATTWLREAHAQLRASVAHLVDDDLPLEREGYWAQPRRLQWTIEIMIQHDLYHAGEINHIRALHQGNDA